MSLRLIWIVSLAGIFASTALGAKIDDKAKAKANSKREVPAATPAPKPVPVPVAKTPANLDQKKIHAIYSEGEFDKVVSLIEEFTNGNPAYSKTDSIFIAKHLAVVYTANPATRERGKHFMFKLLDLLPSAKIVDMFVSDEIDHIFEKVREEFVVRQEALGKAPPSQFESNQYAAGKMSVTSDANSSSRPVPAARSKKGSSNTVYWVIGGTAAIAAAGAAAYFLLPSDSPDREYDITPP